MEKTNLNFNTVKTNLDDKKNLLLQNNFIDTNNYVKQNIYTNKQNNNVTDFASDNNGDQYMYHRSKQIIPGDNTSDASKKKIVGISTSTQNYKVTRINVDSRYRNKIPKNILDSIQHILPNNPFYFQKGSNLLTIYDPNHEYLYGDKIILQNVTINTVNNKIVFEEGNSFIKIEYENHNLNQNYNYIVLIENFNGNNSNNTFFDNIPINYLNKIHTVYFSNETDTADNNYFYIKINIFPTINNNTFGDIKLYSLNGIPLNLINSNYPININQLQSNLIITNIISSDFYQVNLNGSATIGLNDNTSLNNLVGVTGIGGNNINISKIVDVIEGFPEANQFKYNLGKNFNKVRKIRLLSTEIPNTEKIIRKYPANKQNNLLYWQNVNDGDYIYSIEVTPGNYSTDDLASEIQNQIISVPRISEVTNTDPTKIINLNDHFVTINITQSNNKFEINFYTTAIVTKAIKKSTYKFTDGYDRIIINHINHKLSAGDFILIQNAVATESIPTATLNGTFKIELIVDTDNYQIKLGKYNADSFNEEVTGGGNAINLLTPLRSRLLFNTSGTIGDLLGFRNVGDYNAITAYSTRITNYSEYELDTDLNSIGIFTKDLISNNLLNLGGYNYIFLTINHIFKDSIDMKNITNIFAKLLLSASPNNVIYNDFIQLGQEFMEVINSLSEIEFSFYSPDGILFDFNNIDVSFTIELFEELN
jgi:hypothetical protein